MAVPTAVTVNTTAGEEDNPIAQLSRSISDFFSGESKAIAEEGKSTSKDDQDDGDWLEQIKRTLSGTSLTKEIAKEKSMSEAERAEQQLVAADAAYDSTMQDLVSHLTVEQEAMETVMHIKAEQQAKHERQYRLSRTLSAENLAREVKLQKEAQDQAAEAQLNALINHQEAEREAMETVMHIKAEEQAKHERHYRLSRTLSAENLAKEAAIQAKEAARIQQAETTHVRASHVTLTKSVMGLLFAVAIVACLYYMYYMYYLSGQAATQTAAEQASAEHVRRVCLGKICLPNKVTLPKLRLSKLRMP